MEMIGELLQRKEPSASRSAFHAAETPLEKVLEQLSSQSLFGSHDIVMLDHVQELKKEGREALAPFLRSPSPFVTAIFGGSSFKPFADLYQMAKKVAIVLDLSDEKPWDREKRIREWLSSRVQREKKVLTSDAAAFLMEQCGADMALLEQELIKCICFAGERQKIELRDVEAIGSAASFPSGWQFAESLVWQGGKCAHEPIDDISSLLLLIGQLRYHLQLGMQIASLLNCGKTGQEIAQALPQVRRNLDQYISIAQKRPLSFFQQGIRHLFEVESQAKNSSHDPALLLDLFVAKMRLS